MCASVGSGLSRLGGVVLVLGLGAVLAAAPSRAADPPSVVLNEVNCTGTDWVELINRGTAEVSIAGWLLTDDPVNRVPPRDSHRMRFPAGTVLAPGARLVVSAGAGGFPFGLSCGDDTLSLADAGDVLVDAFALPVLSAGGMTLGRVPDGTGDWTVTLPTPGAANAVAAGTGDEDPAWLYDPLQVTEIELEASDAALAGLRAVPDEYVEARITLHNAGNTYGPYAVGLKLKGHTTFRTLDGKAAFKVKFGFSVSGQRFFGLKALTLNNMVQDPSMLAEATSSLFLRAVGVPTARVGYAYVRLNGVDYGLHADVETVDAVMMARWFDSTQHVYEANDPGDFDADPATQFQVQEGSSTNIADLQALVAAYDGGSGGWLERMQGVADLPELVRAFAAEHYAEHWDGYSIGTFPADPHNYYLQSDATGRFSLVPSGTDQTWDMPTAFGSYGKGVLMRSCVADAGCRQLYLDSLRQIAASPVLVTLADEARAIRAVIAPWRELDPRREQTAAEGEASADAKIAAMTARPAELAAWLRDPTFTDGVVPPRAGGGSGPVDVGVTGSVSPAVAPVGASHVWRVAVTNTGAGTAEGVVLDVQLSPNVAYGFSEVTRGPGCTASGSTLHCELDWLGPWDDDSAAEVVIGTNVTGAGEVSLTAAASFRGTDPTPDDDVITLTANTPVTVATAQQVLTPPVAVRPVLGKPAAAPKKPVAGKRFTFSLPVTRSDTGARLTSGKLDCTPSLSGKTIKHAESFKGGTVRLSLVVPKAAKGKLLKVEIGVTASGKTVRHTYTYAVY